MTRHTGSSRIILLVAVVLAACSTTKSPQSCALTTWESHMRAIDREISILKGERNVKLTSEELIAALEFFQELTDITLPVSYSPIGPIIELEDLVRTRQQWHSWLAKTTDAPPPAVSDSAAPP